MMLFINAISRGICCPNLGYWVKDYESAFERLTCMAADNWTLLDAKIIDGYDQVALPVEAFDGQPIQVHIRALQKQWDELILAKPVFSGQFSKPVFEDRYRKLDSYYSALLTHFQKSIFLMETAKRKLVTGRDPELATRLSRQYTFLLESNRRMYQQTTESRQKNRQRLLDLG